MGGFFDGLEPVFGLALHGNAIALGRHRASAAHAHVSDRVTVMLGGGTHSLATVVAIYSRDLGFGDALLAPELGDRASIATAAGADSDAAMNRWLIGLAHV